MNVALALKVKAAILAEPHRVNMTYFYKLGNTSCGTAGCIAGHTLFQAGLKKLLRAKDKYLNSLDANLPSPELNACFSELNVVTALLGLSNEEGRLLFFFHSDQGVDSLANSVYRLLSTRLQAVRPGSVAYAKIVAEAIDLCIERNS